MQAARRLPGPGTAARSSEDAERAVSRALTEAPQLSQLLPHYQGDQDSRILHPTAAARVRVFQPLRPLQPVGQWQPQLMQP
ncbi:uncharacterized protein [Bos mutus]|uniref:uncharacterized protein n=1 Tax=Bos mutus TaxID=72004 RepID=UPI0038B5BA6F